VDIIESTLGQVLLLLIGLAVVLFLLILLLVEAHYILDLGRRLVHRLSPVDPSFVRSDSAAVKNGYGEALPDGEETR
jgi:hypothetical protein